MEDILTMRPPLRDSIQRSCPLLMEQLAAGYRSAPERS